MGTKLLLGFGGMVIQVVVHPDVERHMSAPSFGGMVIQVVVHLSVRANFAPPCFGGMVIQVVVHLTCNLSKVRLVSEVR